MRRAEAFPMVSLLAAAVALGLLASSPASAQTTVTIVNMDGAGEGFNSAAAPDADSTAGGNTGATLGEQRRIAFESAAAIWAGILDSSVEIRVAARFDDLYCDATKAILGSAKAIQVNRDFDGAPFGGTWYPIALANKLASVDTSPQYDDIEATFNSAVGTTCPFSKVWYYGLDSTPPGTKMDFVTTVVHELAHGLGFQTYVDLGSGGKWQGYDDIYMRFLEDHSTGKHFPDITDAQRAAACIDTGDLHWTGPRVVAASVFLTAGRVQPSGHVQMYAPNPVSAGSSVSHFSNVLSPNEAMEPAYSGPKHDPGLGRQLMEDIGWLTGAPTDLYFVVDTTGSFFDDLPVFKTEAPEIIQTLTDEGTDLKVGLASFEDYPISPFGSAVDGDVAYRRIIDLTSNTATVTTAIGGLFVRYGMDGPESQLAALYQAATGAGQTVAGYPGANIPAGQQATFRDGAVKLFLLWTDAPFHRPGDPGTIPYPGPSFDDTVAAIKALDPPKVIGVASGSAAGTLEDLRAIAEATGALAPEGGVDCDADGTIDIPAGDPLVCATAITGAGVGAAMLAVVQAAQQPTSIQIEVRDAINLKSRLVAVTIPGKEGFRPDQEVAWKTVCFGREAVPGVGNCTESHGRSHVSDVNGDSRLDLVLHYDTAQTGIRTGDTQVCVTGHTYAGTALQGCTSIAPAKMPK